MRPLEIVLLLSCLPTLILGIAGFRMPAFAAALIAFIPLLTMGLQWIFEGGRLPMVPTYAAALVCALGASRILAVKPLLPAWAVIGLCLVGFVLLAVSIAWTWCLPIFTLPRPPGPHFVGTIAINIPDPDGTRISLRIWYPADSVTGCRRAPYTTDGEQLDSQFAASVPRAKTNAFESAPPATAPTNGWPALLYTPSWDGSLFENTTLCEALASEGFVVIAIARPEGPDLPPLDFTSEAGLERFDQAMEKELRLRTCRLLSVLAALPDLDSGSLDAKKPRLLIDPQAIGAMGYSFGGAVAAEACRIDPRLRCGMNLDGTLFGDAARYGARQPFLFVTDTAPMPAETDLHSSNPETRRAAEFYTKSFLDIQRWLKTHGGWLVRIEGVQHANFSDRSLYSPFRRLTGAGPRNARETLSVIIGCTTQFFDAFLRQKDRPGTWLNKPGVTLEKYPRPEDL